MVSAKYPHLGDPKFLEFFALKNQSRAACQLLGQSKEPAFLAAYARVHGLISGTEEARKDALGIFDDAITRGAKLTSSQLDYYLFLLMHFGRFDDAKKLAKKDFLLAAIAYEAEPENWFPKFRKLFGGIGADLRPLKPAKDAFRLLDSQVPANSVSGDSLVSVIMTTFKPNEDAEHAINSILNQTYGNFELIIVDDGSGSEYHELLKRYQAKDERIRLVLLEKNMGTYGARNIGWLHANGRYLTGQDSDDWSHPRRLELQVRDLDSNPQRSGNWCQGIRVNEHLQLDIRDGNFPLRTGDRSVAVSMMIRHSPTFLRLGFFDGVRKAADTEYVQRMKAVFGQDSFGEIAEVLYVIQARYDSLSRTDFAPDWKHPNRQIYATVYSRWHRKISSGKESAYFMELENVRKFPAPFAFTPAARSNAVRDFDLVFLGDWYSESTRQTWLLNQVRGAIASGKKVGFAHVDGLFKKHARQGKPSNALLELYESGQVDFVALDDKNVNVSKLVSAIEYPVFAEEKPSSVSVKKVELFRFADSLDELTEPAEKNARLIFGVSPEVLEATN